MFKEEEGERCETENFEDKEAGIVGETGTLAAGSLEQG